MITKMGSSSSGSSGGGGGGLFSALFGGSSGGGLFGGGGSSSGSLMADGGDLGGSADASSLFEFGGFREGGISGFPAGSAFSASLYGFGGAPHFAEGSTNTGAFAGGMPAILHQNEAIIPLSRGRAVPVEFSGQGPMAQSQLRGAAGAPHITFNVTSPDPDSFRRSQSQMATQAYAVGAKAAKRNM